MISVMVIRPNGLGNVANECFCQVKRDNSAGVCHVGVHVTEYTVATCPPQLLVFDSATVFHQRQCFEFDTALKKQSVSLNCS